MGTCLSVRLEGTVGAGSGSGETISAACTPELCAFWVLWEDQRSDRLLHADGWVPNVKCKRKEKSGICETKELLHEKKAPCSAEDVTWISSDSISMAELLPVVKGGELGAPRSHQGRNERGGRQGCQQDGRAQTSWW